MTSPGNGCEEQCKAISKKWAPMEIETNLHLMVLQMEAWVLRSQPKNHPIHVLETHTRRIQSHQPIGTKLCLKSKVIPRNTYSFPPMKE
jgi:hypothetical protein